jgi:AmmeMemoRadiSam system protein B/AmmeMemoRadiSam system protein A
MFYPEDPDELRTHLNSMLADVATAPPPGRPLVLVEPHAGYVYSGQVAAHGYKLLLERDIRTVVVISPSHVEHFSHVAVFDGDAYETPLGPLTVDREFVDAVTSANDRIQKSDRGHVQGRLSRGEHALEVQLPFLQAVLPSCSIVPIVMGDQDWEYCRALGEALGPHLQREDVLIVASSDLSHFYSDDVARKLDAVFLETMTNMDPRSLYESVKERRCEACGTGPIVAALIAASFVKTATCSVLSTANSGDVSGDRSQVVGYASAVVLESGERKFLHGAEGEAHDLGEPERAYLLARARNAIAEALGVAVPQSAPRPDSTALTTPAGGFVTLTIGGRLRGCVGTIEAEKPLDELVRAMASAAAFSDPRFPGLTSSELENLHIEISILSTPERITGPADVEVGRHGLIVESGERRGLLLPQVAGEHGWDAVTFLERTSEKAGLPPDGWTHPEAAVYSFTASVFGDSSARTR